MRCHFPVLCFAPSLLRRGLRALGTAVFDLIWCYEYFGRHSRNVSALRIVEANFQDDRLDIALAAADVALRRIVSFDAFKEHLSAGKRAPRQAHAQSVPVA